LDKLVAMRAFVEIVDRGSLTAAGERLGKSLPTMVRTLAALEKSLGAVLLRRTTRSMSLTAEGRDYLARCRRILADVEEAELALGAEPSEPRGELRMTAPLLFGQMHVAPAVVDFVRRHTQVSVDLLLVDRVIDLVDEGIDVALRIAPLADSSMIAIPVGEVRRVVVASPELLERTDVPQRPEDLADRPCVRFSGISPSNVWRFRERGKDLSIHARGGFTCNQASASLEACAGGLGFGRFLCYQAEPLVAAGRLRVVLRDFEPEPVPVSLCYRDARLVSTRLRALLDFLRDRLRARPVLPI
jgi:DNA-binding transcriptional LysR family regulator